jgi:hypothetical protein
LAAIAQPSIGPDEISIRNAPYSPRSAATFTSTVRQVEIPVIVRDAEGHAGGNLKAQDFEVAAGMTAATETVEVC